MNDREIVVENLFKTYAGKVAAVKGISFKVDAGKIFGFLGPNGAGKSTTIKILTTLALPTSGWGLSPQKLHTRPAFSHLKAGYGRCNQQLTEQSFNIS